MERNPTMNLKDLSGNLRSNTTVTKVQEDQVMSKSATPPRARSSAPASFERALSDSGYTAWTVSYTHLTLPTTEAV